MLLSVQVVRYEYHHPLLLLVLLRVVVAPLTPWA
jgi:hypothetical protein